MHYVKSRGRRGICRLAVVAPAGTGKTTIVGQLRRWNTLAYDPDAAFEPGPWQHLPREELDVLRERAIETGDWSEYSAVWHRQLREYVEAQGSGIFFFHSGHDLRAALPQYPRSRVIALTLPAEVHLDRLAGRSTRALKIAKLNRDTVIGDRDFARWIRLSAADSVREVASALQVQYRYRGYCQWEDQ